MRTISSQYKDDVQIIMHNYPFINASSNDLALAGECANEQGLFWNIHDRFFQSSAPAENILAIARQSGLNMQQFASCMENEKYADKIQEEKSLAETIVPGTPTWIINGHLIPYASEETFKQIIDALVKNL